MCLAVVSRWSHMCTNGTVSVGLFRDQVAACPFSPVQGNVRSLFHSPANISHTSQAKVRYLCYVDYKRCLTHVCGWWRFGLSPVMSGCFTKHLH